jgi:putative transcriptional regulator
MMALRGAAAAMVLLFGLLVTADVRSRLMLETLDLPESGVLLVAARKLADPNFSRSIVLLVDHSPQGTLGVILNRPTDVPLHRAVEGVSEARSAQHRMHFGGPVLTRLVTYLARHQPVPEPSMVIEGDVFFGGDPKVLLGLLDEALPAEALRVFAGHAGWAPGQLQAELDRRDWHLVRLPPELFFTTAPEALWDAVIDRLDPPTNLAMHVPVAGARGSTRSVVRDW